MIKKAAKAVMAIYQKLNKKMKKKKMMILITKRFNLKRVILKRNLQNSKKSKKSQMSLMYNQLSRTWMKMKISINFLRKNLQLLLKYLRAKLIFQVYFQYKITNKEPNNSLIPPPQPPPPQPRLQLPTLLLLLNQWVLLVLLFSQIRLKKLYGTMQISLISIKVLSALYRWIIGIIRNISHKIYKSLMEAKTTGFRFSSLYNSLIC